MTSGRCQCCLPFGVWCLTCFPLVPAKVTILVVPESVAPPWDLEEKQSSLFNSWEELGLCGAFLSVSLVIWLVTLRLASLWMSVSRCWLAAVTIGSSKNCWASMSEAHKATLSWSDSSLGIFWRTASLLLSNVFNMPTVCSSCNWVMDLAADNRSFRA